MKNKFKLNLINNYIAINRILYVCKSLLNNNRNLTEIQQITMLISSTINLKISYEKTFDKYLKNDNSFLLLKKQLNDTMTTQGNHNNCNEKLSDMLNKLQVFELEHNNILLKTK